MFIAFITDRCSAILNKYKQNTFTDQNFRLHQRLLLVPKATLIISIPHGVKTFETAVSTFQIFGTNLFHLLTNTASNSCKVLCFQ